MSLRLVVVDDAPFIREMLRHIAGKSGIEIVGEAEDGVQGVEVVREKRPDVVLMDIVMPRLSGIEATKQIINELPEQRIIACSTESQESMVMKALAAGCCDFVAKPFKTNELIKAIKAAAEK